MRTRKFGHRAKTALTPPGVLSRDGQLENLPPRAISVFRALRDASEAMEAGAFATRSRRDEARVELTRHSIHEQRLRRSHASGGYQIDDEAHPTLAVQMRKTAAAKAEFDRLSSLYDKLVGDGAPLRALVENLERFITRVAVVPLDEFTVPPPPLAKDQTFLAAVEGRRTRRSASYALPSSACASHACR